MVSWLSVLEHSLRQKVGLQDIVRDSHIRRHPFEGVSFVRSITKVRISLQAFGIILAIDYL